MKKKSIIILSISGLVIIIIGIILLTKNNIMKSKNELEIIDATYTCAQIPEKFYEDDKYVYSFTCTKSNSMFVKFENGNKMLITSALEAEKVTIKELLDAGLDVIKVKK